MTFPRFKTIHTRTVAALLVGVAATLARADQLGLAKLEALRLAPESAGALVYRGDTFAQRTPAGAPLYRYERRVLTAPTGLAASHITSDSAGNVVIVESALVSPTYEVQRFEVANRQTGVTGAVHISHNGHHLEYTLNDKGKASTASEDVSDPVVCGPSLFGFILQNWGPLTGGATIPVRMLVIQDKTSYGFNLKFEKLLNGQASFTLTPGNFLIRMAIAPLRVVFDASTKTVLRYEGRVPPMENVSGKLKDLDARVEYTAMALAYR